MDCNWGVSWQRCEKLGERGSGEKKKLQRQKIKAGRATARRVLRGRVELGLLIVMAGSGALLTL